MDTSELDNWKCHIYGYGALQQYACEVQQCVGVVGARGRRWGVSTPIVPSSLLKNNKSPTEYIH